MYATCETTGCGNVGLPLEVPPDMTVICGVCSRPVTNITDIKPEPGRELPEWILQMLQTQNSAD